MSGGAQSSAMDETTEFNSNPSSVHSYAYAEDRNMRFRPHMEDTHCIVDKMGGDNSCGLFAVFDGHGGKQVSDHCADRFPIELRKELQKNPQDLCKPIIDIFSKIDNELRLLDAEGCGSTAGVAIVRREGAHNVLYCANIGDTRVILGKGT